MDSPKMPIPLTWGCRICNGHICWVSDAIISIHPPNTNRYGKSTMCRPFSERKTTSWVLMKISSGWWSPPTNMYANVSWDPLWKWRVKENQRPVIYYSWWKFDEDQSSGINPGEVKCFTRWVFEWLNNFPLIELNPAESQLLRCSICPTNGHPFLLQHLHLLLQSIALRRIRLIRLVGLVPLLVVSTVGGQKSEVTQIDWPMDVQKKRPKIYRRISVKTHRNPSNFRLRIHPKNPSKPIKIPVSWYDQAFGALSCCWIWHIWVWFQITYQITWLAGTSLTNGILMRNQLQIMGFYIAIFDCRREP